MAARSTPAGGIHASGIIRLIHVVHAASGIIRLVHVVHAASGVVDARKGFLWNDVKRGCFDRPGVVGG